MGFWDRVHLLRPLAGICMSPINWQRRSRECEREGEDRIRLPCKITYDFTKEIGPRAVGHLAKVS